MVATLLGVGASVILAFRRAKTLIGSFGTLEKKRRTTTGRRDAPLTLIPAAFLLKGNGDSGGGQARVSNS
jgi:hypothetical protein